jgi:hypothetical protein
VLTVVLGLTGCTDPAPTRQSRTERPTTEKPAGRDQQRVVDALRRLDMCALLDVAVGSGRKLRAHHPSTCSTFDSAPEVSVSVARMPADKRADLKVKELGGAKAYAPVLDGSQTDCAVHLPVSAALVIAFRSGYTCAEIEPMVAEAATALREPSALEGEPRWEACTALHEVAGVDVVESLDLCSDTKTLAILEFRYSTPGAVATRGWTQSTIEGVEVSTSDDRDPDAPSCTSEWSVGPALSDHADGELVARVRAIDCSKVTPLVAPLITVLGKKPDAGDPQRPLLYAPGEPDHPQGLGRSK